MQKVSSYLPNFLGSDCDQICFWTRGLYLDLTTANNHQFENWDSSSSLILEKQSALSLTSDGIQFDNTDLTSLKLVNTGDTAALTFGFFIKPDNAGVASFSDSRNLLTVRPTGTSSYIMEGIPDGTSLNLILGGDNYITDFFRDLTTQDNFMAFSMRKYSSS